MTATPMTFSPLVERLVLAGQLRGLRVGRELKSTKVSAALGWNSTKVSDFENAKIVLIDRDDITILLRHYGVEEGSGGWNALLAMAERSRYRRGWWRDYDFRGPLPELETGARDILTFELNAICGLLQTPAYAAAMFRASGVSDPSVIDHRVNARMRRQEILMREHPETRERMTHLHAVLDEGALRMIGSAEVMAEQVRQLAMMADMENVAIQIIPEAAGGHPGLSGAFTVLSYDNGASVAYHETPLSEPWHTNDVGLTKRYADTFAELVACALAPEETAKYLRERARGLTHEVEATDWANCAGRRAP